MKMNKLSIIIGFMVTIVVISAIVFGQSDFNEKPNLIFRLKTQKNHFKLGEPVQFETELVNNGGEPIKVQRVNPELFRMFVSNDKENFVAFVPQKSDRFCGKQNYFSLKSEENSKTFVTVLWQGKPDYSKLDSKRVKWYEENDRKNKIITDFVFHKSGIYYVKFKSKYLDASGNEIEIDSDISEILISDPVGEDLEVWKKIEGRGDLARFLEGKIPDSGEKNIKLIEEVERIISEHPNSIYSSYFVENLNKLKANDKN